MNNTFKNETEFFKNISFETGIDNIFIDRDRDLFDYDVLNIHKETHVIKSYKIPKKLTKEWIIKKINSYLLLEDNNIYRNLSDTFNKIIKKDINFYPTTYGLGTFSAFDTIEKLNLKLKPIEDILKQNNIEYKKEFSDAFFVYRIIISKKKENLLKIKNISSL